jgi:hypothetical protein
MCVLINIRFLYANTTCIYLHVWCNDVYKSSGSYWLLYFLPQLFVVIYPTRYQCLMIVVSESHGPS